jgi:murein DD-endopeptidase MepM/ murein hydrolase activator NlpD
MKDDGNPSGYDPLHFPVQIPEGFEPDISDGIPVNYTGKECKTYHVEGYRPLWGGGYDAARGKHKHKALDVMAVEGAPICATRGGKVAMTWRYRGENRDGAGFSERGGWYVRIEYDDGRHLGYYAHLLKLADGIGPGATVEANQIIGWCGASGNAGNPKRGTKNPHLHYAVTDLKTGRKVRLEPPLKKLYDADGWRRS